MTINDYVQLSHYDGRMFHVLPEYAYIELYNQQGLTRKQIDQNIISSGLFPESLLPALAVFGVDAGKAFAHFWGKKIVVLGDNPVAGSIIHKLCGFGIGEILCIDYECKNQDAIMDRCALFKSTNISFLKRDVRPHNAHMLFKGSDFIVASSHDMQAKFEAFRYSKENNTGRLGIFVSDGNTVVIPANHHKDITGIFKRFTKGFETFTPAAVELTSSVSLDNIIKALLYPSLPEENIITLYHTDPNPSIFRI